MQLFSLFFLVLLSELRALVVQLFFVTTSYPYFLYFTKSSVLIPVCRTGRCVIREKHPSSHSWNSRSYSELIVKL